MIGQLISHYRILKKLGEGGMGEVYLAEDTNLGREAAIKFLSSDDASDPESRLRFNREARAQAMLSHSNIATFYEVGEEQGCSFIAMEYIEGQKLSDLAKMETLSTEGILDLSIQIGEGLSAAHERGVIHRDVKPANILVTSKGVPKITDFGLAKWRGASTITRAGAQMGTDLYMSPEQIDGRKVDHRTDIFSLGVILYELICGRRPFAGANRESTYYEILFSQPQPLARYSRHATENMERIVFKCLAKKPEERYQSVADLVADLRAEKRAVESNQSQFLSAKPPRRRWLFAGVGAAVLLAAILIVWTFIAVSESTSDLERSVAVLPFTNMSEDRENEYFSDGITEDIIAQLSKLGELKVISRSSVMRYKSGERNIREIGKALGVGAILEGSVRRAGTQVRIVAQLIDARNEGHMWAETYDKELIQIFDIQSEIARQIASSLKATLSPAEEERLEKRPTANLTAYDYYLKGREYYYRYLKEDNEHAISLFKKAIALDSSYATAYAGLGDAIAQRKVRFGFSPDWADSAVTISEKAIAIDPNSAEGFKALGLAYAGKGWTRKALESYERAISLNPNYFMAVGNMGDELRGVGQLSEALHWGKKAVALSPTTAYYYYSVGQTYLALGDDVNAEQWTRKALDIQPDFHDAYNTLGWICLKQSHPARAIEHARKALSFAPDCLDALGLAGYAKLVEGDYAGAQEYFERAVEIDSASYLTSAGHVLWKTGQRDEAEKVLQRDLERAHEQLEERYEWPKIRYDIATINAILGDTAGAYRWLTNAIEAGWRDYRWGLMDTKMESIRNDELFQRMMAQVKADVDEMRNRAEINEPTKVEYNKAGKGR